MLTEQQTKEFETLLTETKSGWDRLKTLPDALATLRSEHDASRKELSEIRRDLAIRASFSATPHTPGRVSDDCARRLTGIALAARLRSGKQLENAARVQAMVKDILGIEVRTALSSTDIPLPTEYSAQVVELVSQFGAARRYGTVYPLGTGTVKLPRLKTDPAFGLIAQSAAVAEKSPQTAWV